MSFNIPTPDFDMLMSLYQDDPEAFEAFRRRLLRDAVASAPPAHHECLEQLLVRIDAARDATSTPLEAAQVAFRMMQDSVGELRAGWEHAHEAIAGLQAAMVIASFRR